MKSYIMEHGIKELTENELLEITGGKFKWSNAGYAAAVGTGALGGAGLGQLGALGGAVLGAVSYISDHNDYNDPIPKR